MNLITKGVGAFLVVILGALHVQALDCQKSLADNCGTPPSATNYSAYVNYSSCSSQFNQMCTAFRNNTYSGTTSTGVKPPNPPNYAQCSRTDPQTGAVSQDQQCMTSLEQAYQAEYQRYLLTKQQEEQARQFQLQQQAAEDSAKRAAEEAQRQALQAQQNYQQRQMLSTITSLGFQMAFTASCSTVVGCNPGFAAAAMAFGIYAGMAGQQANNNANTAYSACTKAGQLSTTGTGGCGGAPPAFDPSGYPSNTYPPVSNVVDPSGKCIADPTLCNEIQNNLPPGITLKDVAKGMSNFANGKGLFHVNKDGSITLGNGKRVTPDILQSRDSLIAAGLTPAQADALTGMMNKGGLNGIDTKSALAKENAGLSGDGSGSDADANGAGRNGVAGGAGNGGINGSDADAAARRRGLASAEGLVKDFNGESIGVAGDDIWKMMNRRYKAKASQDSFIAAKP